MTFYERFYADIIQSFVGARCACPRAQALRPYSRRGNAWASAPATVFLCFVLCLSVTTAQAEQGERPPLQAFPKLEALEPGAEYRATPEVQAYAALCKAIYWQRMGHQTSYRERSRRIENYQRAKEQLMTAILFNPRSSFLYAKLAEVLIDLGDRKSAESACKKALELNPDNADAHYLLGGLKYALRDLQGAIREFRAAAELNPEHLRAQFSLASLLLDSEDYRGAARAYSEIVKLRPYVPEYRYKLGLYYMRSGEIGEAIEEFNAAARLDEGDLKPHFHLAFLYARKSMNKEAIKECLIFLELSPGEPSTSLLLAELYVAVAEFDKAIPVLEKLVGRQSIERDKLAEAHYRLATAYRGKEENSLADSHLQKSIEIYREILDKDVDNHYYIAMAYDAKGDASLAERHLREYIKLRPDEPDAYNYLGYMFVQNEVKLGEAVDLIRKAVAKEPENGAFRDSLGWAYFKLGDLDGAISELEKAVELIPEDSEVREHLGEAYLRKGGEFAKKAILQWEKALEIKPKNTKLQQKLGELKGSLLEQTGNNAGEAQKQRGEAIH